MTEQPTYEQARAELREIVQALESGGQPLEESLALWQRGEELAAICQRGCKAREAGWTRPSPPATPPSLTADG